MDHHLSRRDDFFVAKRAEVAAFYLSDPDNRYRQSGRSSRADRWVETRRCIADAVDTDGSFLDVGCANGLLLETLGEWLGESGIAIEACGVDFIADLVELAAERIPSGQFWVANAWPWEPPRRFDYVRTNLEYVLPEDRRKFVLHQLDWVTPGGRLILCHYCDRGATQIDTASFLRKLGMAVAGARHVDGVTVAWCDVAA